MGIIDKEFRAEVLKSPARPVKLFSFMPACINTGHWPLNKLNINS